jgi:hypothetical protein
MKGTRSDVTPRDFSQDISWGNGSGLFEEMDVVDRGFDAAAWDDIASFTEGDTVGKLTMLAPECGL